MTACETVHEASPRKRPGCLRVRAIRGRLVTVFSIWCQSLSARKSSKEIREAVSDRGSGVRSRGERPPTRDARQEKGTRS